MGADGLLWQPLKGTAKRKRSSLVISIDNVDSVEIIKTHEVFQAIKTLSESKFNTRGPRDL